MATAPKKDNLLFEVIPSGSGPGLDIGGGGGQLREHIQAKGFSYFNLDRRMLGTQEPSIVGDAHILPFKDSSFSIVISQDTLEHFSHPWLVVEEVNRVLSKGGLFIIWVPFMHPFHGDDYYRYTPLGLRHLLKNFQIIRLDSPRWVFTVIARALIELLKRLRLRFLENGILKIAKMLDGMFMRGRQRPASFASGYRVVARRD